MNQIRRAAPRQTFRVDEVGDLGDLTMISDVAIVSLGPSATVPAADGTAYQLQPSGAVFSDAPAPAPRHAGRPASCSSVTVAKGGTRLASTSSPVSKRGG